MAHSTIARGTVTTATPGSALAAPLIPISTPRNTTNSAVIPKPAIVINSARPLRIALGGLRRRRWWISGSATGPAPIVVVMRFRSCRVRR